VAAGAHEKRVHLFSGRGAAELSAGDMWLLCNVAQ